MKATETKLLVFLKKASQFVIPIYQRIYSWTEKECEQLWYDIWRAGESDRTSAHFLGSVVYIEKGLAQIATQSSVLVIDGQQRLTTITLLLEALARQIEEGLEPREGFSAKKIRNYYLLNALEDGDKAFKLLLTQTDRDSLLALIRQKELPENYSIRVKENFEFFERKIASCKHDLAPLCKGLEKLVIVDIALSREQDNPQLIFESMNSTGRELTQADLIRNFILMGLEPEHQTRLYQEHWRPMEQDFGQEAYGKYFDNFMRHYLTVKTGTIPNIQAVYQEFKTLVRTEEEKGFDVDRLVADLHTFAKYYCIMAFGKEREKTLAEAFQDLRELKVEVAYPFLLELYRDYKSDILSQADLLEAIRLIEAYVFRRAVCQIPTNSLNKTFATFKRSLQKENYIESIRAIFMLLPSYRRFPNDEEFKRELKVRDLYNFRSRSYWLRRLENHGRKERVPVGEYTIEHILPQNENLSKAWQDALGADFHNIQQTWLHTLGNLTLTGYNAEYSDRSFPEKRDREGGFKHSPLKLNEGLASADIWNEQAIQARAERLANWAVEVWKAPKVETDRLNAYQTKPPKSDLYTIDDHPNLLVSPLNEIFAAFRDRVLALNPCVSEEFLKLYVAYKAETNFVDVVPQARRLRLSLNMSYPDICDPQGWCKDITHVGRWGNGDVEVGLATLDELPYVMYLVRQSFEKQMGNS
ncbi:MAG: DUF262 and DUF1524 domain-containing protein [Cyanobacteria bacterium P01_E01_bin.42]